MNYDINKSIEILERTPLVLNELLGNLSNDWLMNNEGPETFSPYDVVGHLIHGEKTDWKCRIQRILDEGNTKAFDLFDRFAMYEESKGKTINQLLSEFELLRRENIIWFKNLGLTPADLNKPGLHPKLGDVTLKNLLATWVVHDLTHIAQITRVMAKHYKEDLGPWSEFFRIINF
ncbi:MAG TPA: DinB family protein [Chitinophagaceae bacterium]|nr:DinB family protein [Chitinophagaceae bacterium]